MHRVFLGVLVVILVYLQSRLWFGEGSVTELIAVQEKIERQQFENKRLQQRNQLLANEIIELQGGLEAVEENARQVLGMIKNDETYYLVYE